MNSELKDNYNVFKSEMRKFLKRSITQDQSSFLNNQLKSIVETLQEINKDEFDMETQLKINTMQQDFMPYMLGYWMIKETNKSNIINQNSFGSSV